MINKCDFSVQTLKRQYIAKISELRRNNTNTVEQKLA